PLAAGGNVSASGAGTPLTLAASTNFINDDGPGALTTGGGGRWLVYSAGPAGDSFGTMDSGNQAIWNAAYPTAVTPTGNRYVFATQPTATYTSTDVTKTYGSDVAAIVANAYTSAGFVDAATYGGVFTQDTAANIVTGAPAVTSTGSAATAHVAGSPYVITVSTAPATPTTGYALAAASTGTLTINPAALTLTANSQVKPYGSLLTFAGTEFASGVGQLRNGDTVGSVTLTSAGAPAGAPVAGSPYAIIAGGAAGGTFAASDYVVAYVNGVLAVTQRGITATADDKSRIYGDANPALTYQITTGALANGDTLAGSLATSAEPASDVGLYSINRGTLANPNYLITYVPGTLNIRVRPVTVSALAGSKVYGNPDPLLPYSTSGLGAGAPLAGSLDRAAGENVGSYGIGQGTVTNAANTNYAISFVPNLLDVTPRPLSLIADDKSKLQGQANPPLTAHGSGFAFADGFANLSGILTLTTSALTASPTGLYGITPSGVSSSNYSISFVDGTLFIGPQVAPPVVVPTPLVEQDFGYDEATAFSRQAAMPNDTCGGPGEPCVVMAVPAKLRVVNGGMRLPAGLMADRTLQDRPAAAVDR
ncbi:MAG: MBG domain-containing protein, partial [Casimicrobiaceae bacterium]